MIELAGYAAIVTMGIVLGMLGGGGAILTVPIMVYLFGHPPVTATSYSLFVVGLTATIGSVAFVKAGDVRARAALAFALPSAAGVFLSRHFLVRGLPNELIRIDGFVLDKDSAILGAFAVLMLMASVSMIRGRAPSPTAETTSRSSVRLALQGLAVGAIVGFVGAGGGFLIVPLLVVGDGLPMRAAVGTSLTIIAIQSLLGFLGDWWAGTPVDWAFLGAVSALAAIGILIGSRLARHVSDKSLKKAFGYFVLLMGSVILAERLM